MSVFERMRTHEHEQVVFCSDPPSGLKAIIAVHNTNLGPALGGTRMWMYATEGDALNDVLRLARGMTYKAAVAGLNLGGGKAVIMGDPNKDKTEALFRAFPTFEASNRLAEQRIKAVGRIKSIYAGKSQFVGRLGEYDFGKR